MQTTRASQALIAGRSSRRHACTSSQRTSQLSARWKLIFRTRLSMESFACSSPRTAEPPGTMAWLSRRLPLWTLHGIPDDRVRARALELAYGEQAHLYDGPLLTVGKARGLMVRSKSYRA